MDSDGLLLGAGGLVLSGLVYFAGVWSGRALERRTIKRDDTLREREGREARVSEVVREYRSLVRDTGAGANMHTLRDSGIANLKTDAEAREAIERISANGKNPMGAFWNSLAIEGLDLAEVFRYSRDHDVTVEAAIEAVNRKRFR